MKINVLLLIIICTLDALKDIKHATDDELTNCVDDATIGRYAGNIDIEK